MVEVGPASATQTSFRFVDWGAVIAGAVMAAALSLVLLTFGTAIGLFATPAQADAVRRAAARCVRRR